METLKADQINHTEIEPGTHLVSASGVKTKFNDHVLGDYDFASKVPAENFTLKGVRIRLTHWHPAENTVVYLLETPI